jgi:hypothetical protein
MVRARSSLAAEQSRGSHGCATGHTLAWGRSSAQRLRLLARRYHFRVGSLVVLHADGDAPQIRLESDHPEQLIRHLSAIVHELERSPTANCWASDACFNGLWIEAEDASGKPFVATSRVLAGPAGDGGYGSQWVRDGLPYPYPHG